MVVTSLCASCKKMRNSKQLHFDPGRVAVMVWSGSPHGHDRLWPVHFWPIRVVCVVCVLCVCVLCVVCVFPTFRPLRRTAVRRTALRRTAQNFALFFPLPPYFRSFWLSLGVFSWNFGGVFEGGDPKMCAFQCPGASNTTKIPREDRQRKTKRAKMGRERGKKAQNFGPPTLLGPHPSGPPPFGAPTLRGPHPSGPPPFQAAHVKPLKNTLAKTDWPKTDWPQNGLAKNGFGPNWPGLNTMAKNGLAQNGLAKNGQIRMAKNDLSPLHTSFKLHAPLILKVPAEHT